MAQRVLTALLMVAIAGLLWTRVLPSGVPLSDTWGDGDARRDAAAIVRAAYDGRAVPAVSLPAEPARRVFVTAHGRGWRDRAGAQGATTAQSLEIAARQLGDSVRRAVANGKTPPEWLVVDVVAGEQRLRRPPDHDFLERQYETGVDGLLAETPEAYGVVLPGDPITEGWFSPRPADPKGGGSRWYTRGDEGMHARKAAATRLAQASGAPLPAHGVRWTRFRTESFLLRPEGDTEPIRLYRGMPVGELVPEPARIREAALAGGDWLVSMLDSSGKFQYTYVPNRDEDTPPGSYSYIRHTATAWMMVRLGRRFDQPAWVDAAVRALRWSETQLVPAPVSHAGRADRGQRRWIVASGREAKGGLGHNAVTIIALAEIRDLLTPEQIEKVKGLGISLEMMLRCDAKSETDPCVGGDGGFFESEQENLVRPRNKRDYLAYEPGEGFLALVTLAEMFPEEPHWLESARVSGRYQANLFLGSGGALLDTKLFSIERMRFADRVHWQTMALEKLAKLTGEPYWNEVAVAMGEAILATGTPGSQDVKVTVDKRVIGPNPWDYSGSYPLPGRLPRTTPTGSRAEALNAARRCAQALGRDTRPFEAMLLRTAGFQLRNQFTETSCYFCPKPEKAVGAFRAGLTDNEIRIDFIQHVIAGQADTLEWYETPEAAAAAPEAAR